MDLKTMNFKEKFNKKVISIILFLLIILCSINVIATEESDNIITTTVVYDDYFEYRESFFEEKEVSQNKYYSSSVGKNEFLNRIVENLRNGINVIDISDFNITCDELESKYGLYIADCEELFYIEGGYGISYSPATNQVLRLTFKYSMSMQEIDEYWNKINLEVDKYLAEIAKYPNMKTLDKILFTHDYIVNKVSYSPDIRDEVLSPLAHEMVGSLVDNEAVCDGYAKGFNYLLKQVGIEANLVTSVNIRHAWSQVYYSGNYYHIDTTWDDPIGKKIGMAFYDNFMKSDSVFYVSHKSDEGLPIDFVPMASAPSTAMDNLKLNDSHVYATYKDAYWYYITDIDENNCYLNKYDLNNNTITSAVAVNAGYAGWTNNSHSFTSDGTYLYVTNAHQIKQMNFLGTDLKTVKTESNSIYIYSILYKDGVFYYDVKNGSADEAGLRELKLLQSISLNKTKLNLQQNDTSTLEVSFYPSGTSESVTWSSSNNAVATVANGVVTAKSAGSAVITVSTTSGKTATCEVTVAEVVSESEFTILPVVEVSGFETITFAKNSFISDTIIDSNFPLLNNNYTIIVLDPNGKEKSEDERVGAKNTIVIKDENGNEVHSFIAIVRGDADGDGRARMLDAFDMLRDVIRHKEFDDIDYKIRDYNNDGKIRMLDAFDFCREAIRK